MKEPAQIPTKKELAEAATMPVWRKRLSERA